MQSRFQILCLCLSLTAANVLFAEVPPLRPEQLRSDADLIVIGVVESIGSEDKSPKSGFVDHHFALTVTIKSTEKATGKSELKSVVVRGWEAEKRPEGYTGPGGHYAYPGMRRLSDVKAGETLRLFLRREKDGAYEIVSPNGFEVLAKDEKPKSG